MIARCMPLSKRSSAGDSLSVSWVNGRTKLESERRASTRVPTLSVRQHICVLRALMFDLLWMQTRKRQWKCSVVPSPRCALRTTRTTHPRSNAGSSTRRQNNSGRGEAGQTTFWWWRIARVSFAAWGQFVRAAISSCSMCIHHTSEGELGGRS